MKKTEVQGIYKVSEGILINRDDDALTNYKKRRETIYAKNNKMNNLENKVEVLAQNLEEIKTLLKKLTEK